MCTSLPLDIMIGLFVSIAQLCYHASFPLHTIFYMSAVIAIYATQLHKAQEIKSIISAIIRPCNWLSHQVAQNINFPLLFSYIVNINKKSSLHAGEYDKNSVCYMDCWNRYISKPQWTFEVKQLFDFEFV